MSNPKMIKTICGIDKYHQLKRDRSLWGKLRLTWFVVFATLRDLKKQTDQKKDQEKEEINFIRYNDFLNFIGLDNLQFIQLLWGLGKRALFAMPPPVPVLYHL